MIEIPLEKLFETYSESESDVLVLNFASFTKKKNVETTAKVINFKIWLSKIFSCLVSLRFVSNGITLSRENKIKQMQQIISSG